MQTKIDKQVIKEEKDVEHWNDDASKQNNRLKKINNKKVEKEKNFQENMKKEKVKRKNWEDFEY